MLRSSVMALAALFARRCACADAGPGRRILRRRLVRGWDFYGGRFLVATPTRLHEYAAYNPNCAFLRRLVPTPLGPQWQLVPVCF